MKLPFEKLCVRSQSGLTSSSYPAMKPINKQPRSCNLVKRVQIVIRRRTLTPSLVAHTRLCFLMRHTVVAPPDSPRPRGLRGAKPADGGRGTRSPPAGLPAPAGKIVRAARQPRKLASRSLQVKSSSPAARLRTDARHAQRAVFPLRAYSLPTGFNGLSHDGLMHHESSIDIREHYTDTAGAIDHVFGLCQLLGFRLAPRIRDLADRRLYVVGARGAHKALDPVIGGTIDLRVIADNWDEILRLAASIKAGTVTPSAILRRLAAYPRQNALAKALREIGRLERTLFTLDWISDPGLRRRTNAGLNKGEARNALARAVFFHRLGEIRDRTFENQRYRASGLNLAVAAIILWNTLYLGRAVDELRSRGEIIPDELLAHIAPLGWEHIAFNGDYVWPAEPLGNAFRPLRNPRAEFLDAA